MEPRTRFELVTLASSLTCTKAMLWAEVIYQAEPPGLNSG